MSVTEEVFQLEMFWLKLAAELNIEYIVVTEETSQEFRGWLKAVAP